MGGQTQRITLETPGAYEAKCTLDNGNRYVMEPGQSIEIMRSQDDLVVDCYASGNRHISKRVQSGYNGWSTANVANGIIPGMSYDRVSKGVNEYPDVIVIDFTGIPTRGFEMPEYHNKEAPNPYEQPIESYGPNTPRIPGDSMYLPRGMEKRDHHMISNPFDSGGLSKEITPEPGDMKTESSSSAAKPDLQGSTAEELTRSANPSVFKN